MNPKVCNGLSVNRNSYWVFTVGTYVIINVIKFVVVHCVRTVPTQVRQIPKIQVGRFNSGLLCRSQEAINLTVWKVRIEAARVH